MTDREPYTKSCLTEYRKHVEPRQLLGHGGEVQVGDYTRAKLDQLAKLHTPSVWAIHYWCQHHQQGTPMLRDAKAMMDKADVLNEHIAEGKYGGPGQQDPHRIVLLPSKVQDRVDLENQATRAMTFVSAGAYSSAHQAIRDGLKAIERRGIDSIGDDGV